MQKASTLARFKPPSAELRRKMDEAYREAEAQEKQHEIEQRFANAQIPRRFADAKVTDCSPDVKAWAVQAADGGSDWLMLIGKNGRGKTYQACAALNHVCQTTRAAFITATDLVETINQDPKAASRFANIPVLVIDDLGKEDTAAWKTPQVFSVLDKRYSNMKATCITTNLGASELEQHYGGIEGRGSAIVSRLASAKIVRLEGKDRRFQ